MGIVETKMVKFFDGTERQVDIYLPNEYSKNKRYKVIYMHDGQNLFFDDRATFGTCWGIKDICDKKNYPFIIVGIYSGGTKRNNEYVPFECTFELAKKARPDWNNHFGDLYADWIINELMPFINKEYSTLLGFPHTAICGSSLGGVMSSYMGSKYAKVFKYIGVFSLASWYNEKAHLDYIKHNPLNKNQYYYVYVGTREQSVPGYDQMYLEYLSNASNYATVLRKLGIEASHLFTVVGDGEIHNEASWNKYIDQFFQIMMKS